MGCESEDRLNPSPAWSLHANRPHDRQGFGVEASITERTSVWYANVELLYQPSGKGAVLFPSCGAEEGQEAPCATHRDEKPKRMNAETEKPEGRRRANGGAELLASFTMISVNGASAMQKASQFRQPLSSFQQ